MMERNVSLADLTSLGFGGPAEFLSRPGSVPEVEEALDAARRRGLPVHVMGRGTNLMVSDRGVRGLVMVIGPKALSDVRIDGERLTAGAGAPLSRAVAAAIERGLAGLEPLAGIPGSVGGALTMNAGTRDGDIGQVTAAVTAIDREGRPVRYARPDLTFAYRSSSLEQDTIVEAEFDLRPADPGTLRDRVEELRRKRAASQPLGVRSAGCVFKNPPGDAAGRLIDAAGLKGARVGGLEVSARHANFFVNVGGATFNDACRLIDRVRDEVRTRFGVELELEVELWQDQGP
jgi:UDP-N-acetylmuramate dehydrogenase